MRIEYSGNITEIPITFGESYCNTDLCRMGFVSDVKYKYKRNSLYIVGRAYKFVCYWRPDLFKYMSFQNDKIEILVGRSGLCITQKN